jgi:hypothetical protein
MCGSRGTARRVVNFGAKWRRVVVSGSRDDVGPFGREKCLLLLPATEPRFLGLPSISLVTTLTEIHRDYGMFTNFLCKHQKFCP